MSHEPPQPGTSYDSSSQPQKVTKSPLWTIVKVVVVLTVIGLLVKTLPVTEWLKAATAWVESLGYWAPLAFIVIYALCVVLFIPGSVLTAFAGTLFGFVEGSIYVSIASTLGAALAFLVGRHLARSRIEHRIAGNERFAAIDSAVAKEGWKIVGLTRLSPAFPFTLLNYAYGITKVKFSHYVLASWIGMMPGTILYVYVGSLGKAASEAGSRSPAQWAMYGIGLIATIAVTIYVTRIAKRALNQKIHQR